MSKRAKGMRNEKRLQVELEQKGFIVQRACPGTKWSKSTDLFGLFDIIAISRRYPTLFINAEGGQPLKSDYGVDPVRRRYIQVKTNQLPTNKEREALRRFSKWYCDGEDSVEWWCWWERGKRKTKKGWEVEVIQ